MVYLLNGTVNINLKIKRNEKVLFDKWRRSKDW